MQTMSILENLSRTLEEFEAEKQHVTKDQLDVSHKLQTAELNASIKAAEIRMIKWVIGLMIAQTSITIAVLKILGN